MQLLPLVKSRKILLAAIIVSTLLIISVDKTDAAALTGASDTVTTSRPSPSSPTSANSTAPATQLSVFNNGSRFLASDSAKVISSTGIPLNADLRVASQSSALTTVFLGNTTSTDTGAGGDVLYVPITAMHTVQFTTAQNLDTGDDIVITFPVMSTGDANNTASPSASTFQMNGLSTATIKVEDDGGAFTTFTATVTNPSAGTSPIISLNIDSGTIAPGSVVKVYLGCTTWSGGDCTVQTPRIINPTKNSTTTCTGTPEVCTATSYKIRIDAIDSSTSNADTATVGIGIIESVTIRATVDPVLSFTIRGITDGSAVNSGNTSGCLQIEPTNSGITSTANDVNLGILQNTPAIDTKLANISAQRIDVSTNGTAGYSLTATASSSLMNPANGYFLPATTTPTAFPVTSPFFGLHACGQDVPTSYTESGAGGGVDCSTHPVGSTANECHYAWPSTNASVSSTPLSIASDAVGPIGAGSADAAGDGSISISYAAGIDVAVPPGDYKTVITYIATPSFD